MEIIIDLYIVGYFFAFGLLIGTQDQNDGFWWVFMWAIPTAFLSWMTVGLILGNALRDILLGIKK